MPETKSLSDNTGEKRLYWKYRPVGEKTWATVEREGDIADSVREGLSCDADEATWEVQGVWMPPKEFAALSTFTGW